MVDEYALQSLKMLAALKAAHGEQLKQLNIQDPEVSLKR